MRVVGVVQDLRREIVEADKICDDFIIFYDICVDDIFLGKEEMLDVLLGKLEIDSGERL